jgi:enoyl-CoA hydratase/carnithine racemase
MNDEEMQGEPVLREDRESISILTLNRGAYNAWGPDMSTALRDQLEVVRSDPAQRAVLLTGAGTKAFSSGVDVSKKDAHDSRTAERTLAALGRGERPVFADVLDFPKPLVCAVNGYAIGAGFLLALCCDAILVSDNAVLRLSQVELGVIPAYGGLARLAQWVGRGRAFEIGIAGRKVTADEAVTIGLASRCVPAGELREEGVALAARLGALPPLAYAVAKESLMSSLETPVLEAGARADLYRSMALRHTSDSAEAHLAWREKRPPVFRGE